MTLSKFGIPLPSSNGRGGLLQPLQRYRFRVIFDVEQARSIDEPTYKLTVEVMNVNMDFLQKKISVQLRQPIVPSSYIKLLYEVVRTKKQLIYVENLDGSDGVYTTNIFYDCDCIHHHCELDYSKSDFVTHELVFSFGNLKSVDGSYIDFKSKTCFTEEQINDSDCLTPENAIAALDTNQNI